MNWVDLLRAKAGSVMGGGTPQKSFAEIQEAMLAAAAAKRAAARRRIAIWLRAAAAVVIVAAAGTLLLWPRGDSSEPVAQDSLKSDEVFVVDNPVTGDSAPDSFAAVAEATEAEDAASDVTADVTADVAVGATDAGATAAVTDATADVAANAAAAATDAGTAGTVASEATPSPVTTLPGRNLVALADKPGKDAAEAEPVAGSAKASDNGDADAVVASADAVVASADAVGATSADAVGATSADAVVASADAVVASADAVGATSADAVADATADAAANAAAAVTADAAANAAATATADATADAAANAAAAATADATATAAVTANHPAGAQKAAADPFEEPVKPIRKQLRRFSIGASGFLANSSVGSGNVNADSSPKGMVVYTDRNGKVFYSYGAPTVRYYHSAPISGGISLRYSFTDRFYAETGVRLTYLHTWISPSGASQDLLFAGIPVGVGCNFLSLGNFDLYGSLYGMPSKCVWGHSYSNFPSNYSKLSDIPVMWSTGAAVGASYSFTRLLSLFAEPTISYYFTGDDAPQTIYKENPWYFTLNVGLRFNLQ